MHGIPAGQMRPRVLQPEVNRKVRSLAVTAWLAVLASPLGVLGPVEALAQPAGISEASPVNRGQKARKLTSNAVPVTPPAPTSMGTVGVTPAAPSL